MQRLVVLAIVMVACKYPALPEIGGDGGVTGDSAVGSATAPPTDLSYSENPATFVVGSPIIPDAPSSSGGAVASYAVTPTLPDGLALDSGTGIVTGTPTTPTAATAYTVTATNAAGSTTADLVITVDPADPTGLSYSANPIIYAMGIAITPNTPSAGGGAISSYAVAPALPSGLSIDPSTGVITGTPSAETASASYTVTATNAGGSDTVTLSIGVGMTGYVATGIVFACALVSGGVQCWGQNGGGQLGNNSTTNSLVPVQVSGLTTGVRSIAAGGSLGPVSACALVGSGVQCWGTNAYGQLGNNSTTSSSVPVQVSGLTSGGQAICVGGAHACAVVNGGVQCWGYNSNGQLGNNSTTNSSVPVQVTGLTSGVEAVSCGQFHTCAVVNNGVRCWGYNSDGELGNNSTTDSLVPIQVVGLTSGAESVAAGAQNTCALVNGGVQCWGANGAGELGNNSTTSSSIPVAVTGLTSGVEAVGGDIDTPCALTSSGAVKCWGDDEYGELGNNTTTGSPTGSPVPVQVSGLTSGGQALGMGQGNDFSCAMAAGHVECWGYNADGELGNNSTTNSLVPVQVTGL